MERMRERGRGLLPLAARFALPLSIALVLIALSSLEASAPDPVRRTADDAQVDDDDATALGEKAEGFIRAGDFTDAIATLDRAIAANPKGAHNYVLRGASYLHMGIYDKAEMDCTEALRFPPRGRGGPAPSGRFILLAPLPTEVTCGVRYRVEEEVESVSQSAQQMWSLGTPLFRDWCSLVILAQRSVEHWALRRNRCASSGAQVSHIGGRGARPSKNLRYPL